MHLMRTGTCKCKKVVTLTSEQLFVHSLPAIFINVSECSRVLNIDDIIFTGSIAAAVLCYEMTFYDMTPHDMTPYDMKPYATL